MISQGRQVGSLFVTAFFLLTLSACGSGHAGWNNFPVTIYSQSSLLTTPQAKSDFNDALNFWEGKAGKQLFDYQGDYTASATPFTGNPAAPTAITANVIFFQNPWPFNVNIVGQTTVMQSTSQAISGAVIMINPSTTLCEGDCDGQPDATSERRAFTHELGHFLGLVHILDVTNIMYPQIQSGGTLTDMQVDQTTLNTLTAQ
jgi:hypothetical protein